MRVIEVASAIELSEASGRVAALTIDTLVTGMVRVEGNPFLA